MRSSAIERSYILYVPKSYDPTKPAPLVMNFHGYGSSAAQQIAYGDFRSLAERDGFALVAPDGQGLPHHFNLGPPPSGEGSDVQFARDLVADVATKLCVDRTRVYATGMSNGGAMSSILACAASDLVAAVGAVAAVVWVPACSSARPVAFAAFMGTADPIVPFDGGTVHCCGNPPIAGAPATMANWAKHDGCAANPAAKSFSAAVELRRWTSCRAGVAVDFYVIKGGGHTWPGASTDVAALGPTTSEIDASAVLWDFFKAHARPST